MCFDEEEICWFRDLKEIYDRKYNNIDSSYTILTEVIDVFRNWRNRDDQDKLECFIHKIKTLFPYEPED